MNTTRLYINKLPFTLEDEALDSAIREVLESFGEVRSVRLVFEGTTLRPKGLCFAEFSSPEEVEAAVLRLNGLKVLGHYLEVRSAIPRLYNEESEVVTKPVRKNRPKNSTTANY